MLMSIMKNEDEMEEKKRMEREIRLDYDIWMVEMEDIEDEKEFLRIQVDE